MLGIITVTLQFVVNVGLIYSIYSLRKRLDKLEKGADDEQ